MHTGSFEDICRCSPRLSPGRVPVPLEFAHPREIAPAPARIRGPVRTRTRPTTDPSAYKRRGQRVHGQHDALVKASTTSGKAARAHDACSLGGVASGGRSGNRKPSRNSARAPGRTTHVPACKTSTAWRSRRSIRMASANPVPPGSEGRIALTAMVTPSIFAPL
ncbi:hypothetical protein C8R45DRAFT_1110571 [Mycena sanguinolenta]|nr:hypothetical protein C8R45DRAFT_1110571 [Mycena sanguinolenta]